MEVVILKQESSKSPRYNKYHKLGLNLDREFQMV